MSPEQVAMLKLALHAIEREIPNVVLVRGLLQELLIGSDAAEAVPAMAAKEAVSIAEAARRLGYCTKTVRERIKAGLIPAIGSGRMTRVLIDQVLAPTKDVVVEPEPAPALDSIEAAAVEWAKKGANRSSRRPK